MNKYCFWALWVSLAVVCFSATAMAQESVYPAQDNDPEIDAQTVSATTLEESADEITELSVDTAETVSDTPETADNIEETSQITNTDDSQSSILMEGVKENTDNHSESSDSSDELSEEEKRMLLEGLAEDSAERENASAPSTSFSNTIVSAVQSMNPDMAITGDFALAWFSEDTNYQSGAHDPTSTGFQLQQLEMTLGASVDHIFRIDVNLVFGLSGVELEEAYGTTLGLPWNLQLRAGQFLSRFGRINPTHPHSWDFVDQPFVIGKFFGSEGNRGLGLELSWLAPLPWYVEVVGSAQMATSNASNRSYLGSSGKTEGAQDFLYTLAIKQFFPLGNQVGMYWGLSAQTAPNDTGKDNRSNIFGTDLHLKYVPQNHPDMALVFQTEAMFRLRQVPKDLLFDGAGYAQIVWQISRDWATGIRGEYGSGVKDDYLDPFWDNDRWRATVQASWYPSHFSRLRAQASADFPKWQKAPIYALFLALELCAGTHPAHNY